MVHDGADGLDGAGAEGRDRAELVQHLCENGRFEEAQALLDDAWVRDAGSIGYLLRAYVYALRGHRGESREATDWALLHLEGDPVDILCLAGQVLLALGDEHRAVTIGQRATAAAPEDWRPRVLLADAYRELDRIADSVALARRAVALAPDEVETHLALARSLSLQHGLPRLPGSRRRRQTAERDDAWARAAELGADPRTLSTSPPWWRRMRWLPGAVIFLGVQVVVGIDWRLGLLLLAAITVALAGLWWVAVRRTGVRPADRVQAARAAARAELVADPARARAVELAVAVALALAPFFTTGFAAASAADGAPWPVLLTLAVGLVTGVAVLGLGLLVRWWYGEHTLHSHLLRSRFIEGRLVLVLLLSGGTVGLALGGVSGQLWWHALFLAHLVCFAVGAGSGLWHLARRRHWRGVR